MTPEKQKIAIAKACGWTKLEQPLNCGTIWGIAPDTGYSAMVPSYTVDLNAMHKAEKTLNVKSATKFAEILGEVVLDNGCGDYRENMYMLYCLQHANSTQRAEAFLKAIGKWEE